MSADYTEDRTLPVLADSGAPATVTVTVDVVHMCPFKDEVDEGSLTVVFEVADQTIELHSLKRWLDTLDEWKVTHEGFTFHVKDTLQTVGVRVRRCETIWDTAGMYVRVAA